MKGFPNQIADLGKLAGGMRVAVDLGGGDARSDRSYGEALLAAQVIRPGRDGLSIEQYLEQQRLKPRSKQGHQTAARGLRELYRKLGFMEESPDEVRITVLGHQAAAFAGAPLDNASITFWRTALGNMTAGEDDAISHPYQMLLRLVARNPGISRAKCALALEADNDSVAELERIHDLAKLGEAAIRGKIGVSPANWDNAKKMLPRFAEQLGDVVKKNNGYSLGTQPGTVANTRDTLVADAAPAAADRRQSSRQVTSETIARAGLDERKESPPPPDLNPEQMAAAIATRADRVRRHNQLVVALAMRLEKKSFALRENPFDVLAIDDHFALLIEVKTLDGTSADERDRVRDALAQLLYYEGFVTAPHAEARRVIKIAAFESRPTTAHVDWLHKCGIATIWQEGNALNGSYLEDDDWLK